MIRNTLIRNTLMRSAIALVCIAVPALGQAEVRQIATNGVWTAYAGQGTNGKNMCTMLASGGGRYIGMKYFAGDDQLTIHLINNNWTAKPGISVDLTAEYDNLGAWTATATAFKTTSGDAALEFTIPAKQIARWADEFKRSDRLVIRFPGQSNVVDWQVSLDGSDRILEPFVTCMAVAAAAL